MVDFSVLEKQLLAKGYTPEILATLRKSAKSFQKSPGPGTKNGDIVAQASKTDEVPESTPASEQSSLITSKTIENRETELARLEQLKLLMEKKIADKYSTIEKLNAQLFGSENIETETEQLSSKVKLQNLEIAKITYGIDLALLMDCTGSMGSYIKMARQKMVDIIHFAQDIDPRAEVRIAFLGYRDINDRSDRFIKVDFQTKDSISVLTDTLNSVQAMGGGDGPEDIAGALNLALSLGWKSRTRLVVIIGDCPCHGSQYHSVADDYPKGDPFGLVPEDLLIQLASESVNIVFGRITAQTDQMTRIFQKTLEECGRTMRIINASSGPDIFLQELKETMTSSFREAVHP